MNKVVKPYRHFAEANPMKLMDDFFRGNFWAPENYHATPAVNISKTEKGYLVEVSAPGLNKEDFTLSVDEDQLIIKAEHKSETEENTDKFIKKEFDFRSFTRSFTLDKSLDTASIHATYENGVLKINISRKAEEPKLVQNIEIK